jgi:hypothetical protein
MAAYIQYYGLFCEECEIWALDNAGAILYYPSFALAQAHIELLEKFLIRRGHVWVVERIRYKNLPRTVARLRA